MSLNALAAAAVLALGTSDVLACMGSPAPVCGRSTALLKTSPATIVLPATPVPITVPFGYTVTIATVGSCSPPVSTVIGMAATCTPAPSGTGSVTIATPAPGIYSGSVPITFPPGPARVCTVTGTAVTSWIGGFTTTGTGDTVVCFVDPAPGMPGVPRLDLELLTPETQGAHPGDQVTHHYRITNNDPTESVTIDLDADSEQTARLPGFTGGVPGSGDGPIAIADPGDGDNFPIAFLEDLLPPLLPGNNYILDDGSAEDAVGLSIDGSIIWLNQFDVISGQEVIDKVSATFGEGTEGRRVTVLVYDDPNNDGVPDDAVLLRATDATATGEGTGTFNEVQIVPTAVGSVGDSFFVGVALHEIDAFDLAVPLDESSDLGRSYFAASDESCGLDMEDLTANPFPITTVASQGFPGNFQVRAHGDSPGVVTPDWIDLPADPPGFAIPVISRELTLCPGESRDVFIVSRSWQGCPPGSGCEQRIAITGEFSDGSEALACAGAAHLVNTLVPPTFDCGDSGMRGHVQPKTNGLGFDASLPSYDIMQCAQIEPFGFFGATPGPVIPLSIDSFLLNDDAGRISTLFGSPDGLPTTGVDQPFTIEAELHLLSTTPFVETEIQEMNLVGASPIIGDTYFSVIGLSSVSGPDIPVELNAFVENMMQVSVDGITGSTHHAALIDQGSITFSIVDSERVFISLNGVFPFDPALPLQIEQVRLNLDIGMFAGGVLVGAVPPCPEDLDGDGLVGFADLLQMLAVWGPCAGCPEDLNGDGMVSFGDLLQLLAKWGAC